MKKFCLFLLSVFAFPLGAVTVTKEFEAFDVKPDELIDMAQSQHESSKYCGGFISSFSGEIFDRPALLKNEFSFNYSITRGTMVRNLSSMVSEARLLSNIIWFSSYPTRNYQSRSGIQAMHDLASKWQGMAKHLNFSKIELINHKGFKQPSVVLTLTGSTNNVVIVGGHGDSVNNDSDDIKALSPGVDDNASGISVITEIIHVLTQSDYRPVNTIKFMAYAAEEVGLLGSMDISGRFADKNANVLGVIQFDGTNFKGSKDLAMVLISDGTSQEQNKFLGSLIDTYLRVPWRYDKCGYACSDSYSWTFRGFPASFPAEARISEENSHIHTARDTLEVSNNSAAHSVNFAKLGISFVIELDK